MTENHRCDSETWKRATARLNRSVAAMMRRGLDDQTAAELNRAGHTLSSLQLTGDDELTRLGLSARQIAGLRRGGRADIPFATLARVLWKNRSTCCVCRKAGQAIIVHHISPWATSRDHSDANLAVLCLEHHARAHSRGDLEQNLTPRRLRDSKDRWEQEVCQLDARAILEASRLSGHHWWWFNHQRLFELAAALGVRLTALSRFRAARLRGLVDDDGELENPGHHTPYRYQGGDGNVLYAYVREVLETVLASAAVYNISDDLDRGLLANVVKPGDLILVQGRHLFKQRARLTAGPGQIAEVRRQANRVRVSFTVDRWEAVSASAWASWMQGGKSASSIVRIVDSTLADGHLHLACTGLTMGFALEGLSNRSYVFPTWPVDDEIDEDDWLDGFGDEVPA